MARLCGTTIEAVRAVADRIDWDATVHTRFREANVGLRRSVVDAVSWVTGEHGEVIVIEDDVDIDDAIGDTFDAC